MLRRNFRALPTSVRGHSRRFRDVRDMSGLPQTADISGVYAEFFPEAKPARAMVRFGADIPGVLVAIEAIALA